MKRNTSRSLYVLLLFLGVYSLVFIPILPGTGNFWDWSLPFFSSHFANIAVNYSWNDSGLGTPTNYVSSFYLGHFLSVFAYFKIAPEIIIYSLIVSISALSSFVSYFFLKHSVGKKLAVIFALAIVLNPAIFYKLMAGHFAYFFSFAFFICLIFYLVNIYKPTLYHSLVLSLLLLLVSFQIQFVVFSGLVLIIFFALNKQKFILKRLLLTIFVFMLFVMPWLSNFIFGSLAVSSASDAATEMSFFATTQTSLLRIFLLAFSGATNISIVYDKPVLIYFGLFWLLMGLLIFFQKKCLTEILKQKTLLFLIIFLIVILFLCTGYYQAIDIPLLRLFYPVFRESGHFAPLVVFIGILVIAFLLRWIGQINKISRMLWAIAAVYFSVFILINIYYFINYLPRIDYGLAREDFQPFENFRQEIRGTNRVITYPFWNQYSFINQQGIIKQGKLLSNSGWDSYIENSGESHISNYAPGGKTITESLQYRLLKNHDITELEMRNVGFIYDFSKIYSSNFDRYTSSDTYENDISLIKNNSNFFNNLLEKNPGRVTKISDTIYKLNKNYPRLFISEYSGPGKPNLYFRKINPTKYGILIDGVDGSFKLNFLESFDKNWQIYLVDGSEKGLAKRGRCEVTTQDNVTECFLDGSSKELSSDLSYLGRVPISIASASQNGSFGNVWGINSSEKIELILYYKPQSYFVLLSLVSLVTLVGVVSLLYFIRNRKKGG